MKYSIQILAFALLAMLAACSSSNDAITDEMREQEQKAEQAAQEWEILDSVLRDGFIRFNFSKHGNGMYIKDFPGRKLLLDTTVEYNHFLKEMKVGLMFVNPSVCNYSNTKIIMDGKELVGTTDPYDGVWGSQVYEDIFDDQNKTHRLEVLLDSANCGNIKMMYNLVPSKEPGEAFTTEVGFNAPNQFVMGYFDVEVYPAYYGGFYSTYADSIQSKCLLKSDVDSMDLKIEFDPDYDIMNSRYYQHGRVRLDSATLVNFMKGDTLALLSCALVYQTWTVPEILDKQLTYYTRKISFVNDKPKRLGGVRLNDYCINFIDPDDFVRYVFARTTLNGKKILKRIPWQNEAPWNEIYDGKQDESSVKDSVDILVMGFPKGTTEEEGEITEQLSHIELPEGEALLDSLMDVVIDDAGNIKSKFYYMDAVRVPGYETGVYSEY